MDTQADWDVQPAGHTGLAESNSAVVADQPVANILAVTDNLAVVGSQAVMGSRAVVGILGGHSGCSKQKLGKTVGFGLRRVDSGMHSAAHRTVKACN